MMPSSPLLTHTQPEQILAWRQGHAISVREFLAEAYHLAQSLPAATHILNLCADRYHFAVGLAAAILQKKITLLPSAANPESIHRLKLYAPDLFCLCDSEQPGIDLPQFRYLPAPPVSATAFPIPVPDNERCIAIVFTSGTTGTPLAHRKTWGMLAHSSRAEAVRLGLTASQPCLLIGTVPSQHMYGLESTIIMAWQSGNVLCAAHPFYPADICAAIDAGPLPAVLVSTPVHLHALLDSGLDIPPLKSILSATAPLSIQLAQRLESKTGTPVLEIYGTTETGIIATRRPTASPEWRLLPGTALLQEDERIYASSAYIKPPIPLNDRISFAGDDLFLLHGRNGDLINIAGKRNSLANLNHQLNTVPGVRDGVYYMPADTDPDYVQRLIAFVVAPDLNAQQLMAELRKRLDAVFLPRPLVFVTELPRNATGKLPQSALQGLLDKHRDRQNQRYE